MKPKASKYATATVSRELLRDFKPANFAGSKDFKISELAAMLKQHARDQLSDNDFGSDLMLDYAFAFLSQVDYRAIARGLLEGKQ
jgi:hypothetical protein